MSKAIEIPRAGLKIAGWAATSTGAAALEAGQDVLHRLQPGQVSHEEVLYRAALKRFEGRVGIVDLMDPESSPATLRDRAYMAADALAEEGVVQEHGTVEPHPVMPAELLTDPELSADQERALELLALAFEEDYNIQFLPNPEPLTPTDREGVPVDAGSTVRAFGPQAHGLLRQFELPTEKGGNEHPLAMVGITLPSYERSMLGPHTQIVGDPEEPRLLVVQTVGTPLSESELVLH